MYTGALADLNLQISPWTGNRYAFTGGNPITFIEVDGHMFDGYLNSLEVRFASQQQPLSVPGAHSPSLS